MRLALLILTCLTIMTLIAGYMALVDVFDPIGSKAIFGTAMGLLFFGTGLLWVFYLELEKTHGMVEKSTKFHDITGLLNRSESLKRIATQIKSARRHRFPYTILLVGMDGFSDLNQRIGHRGGDVILKHVGERIQRLVREEDIAGHYEGDTFIVAACHSSDDGAAKLADRVREEVTGTPYKTFGVSTDVRISIAVATAPPEEYDPEMLLHTLDERLKLAKSLGGNCTQSES